jgi:pimeloyl-ACP methyl ester carboxylesterase
MPGTSTLCLNMTPTPSPASDAEIRLVAGLDIIIEGRGERTVVMVHGWPDTAALWAPQVAALRTQARCVRFTLPGFDRTHPRRVYGIDEIVSTLTQIVDAVSPHKPVTLLLHDWGCVFGYRYAQTHPSRVAAIIGVDVGDAGSRSHLAGLGWRVKLSVAAYQLCLALAWHLPTRAGDALTRRIARWARAPAEPGTVGAHMNYPYHWQLDELPLPRAMDAGLRAGALQAALPHAVRLRHPQALHVPFGRLARERAGHAAGRSAGNEDGPLGHAPGRATLQRSRGALAGCTALMHTLLWAPLPSPRKVKRVSSLWKLTL